MADPINPYALPSYSASPLSGMASMLAQRQQQFYQTNPYLMAGNISQPIPVQQGPNNLSSGIASGLQGIAKGLLQGYGARQAGEQYSDWAGGLNSALSRPGGLYALSQNPNYADVTAPMMVEEYGKQRDYLNNLSQMQEQERLKQQSEWAKDPRNLYLSAQGITPPGAPQQPGQPVQSGQPIAPGMPMGAPVAPGAAPGTQAGTAPQIIGSVPLPQRIQQRTTQLVMSGLDPTAASSRAQGEFEPEIKRATAFSEEIQALRNDANVADNMAQTVLANYDKAGKTGSGYPEADLQYAIAGRFSPEARKIIDARTALNSIKPDVLKTSRVIGSGAQTDRDATISLESGAGTHQLPEANFRFGNVLAQKAMLGRQKADFLEWYLQTKGTPDGADAVWNQLTGSYKIINRDPQTGAEVINKNLPDWKQALQSLMSGQPQAAPTAVAPPQAPMGAPPGPQAGAPGDYAAQVARLSPAVEKVESSGNPLAISSAGAIGTHQVMPDAMRDVLRSRGDNSKYTDEQLRQMAAQPGASKDFGEAYLGLLLRQYGGDEQKALLAYHSGMGNVAKGTIGPQGKAYNGLVDKALAALGPQGAQAQIPPGAVGTVSPEAPAPETSTVTTTQGAAAPSSADDITPKLQALIQDMFGGGLNMAENYAPGPMGILGSTAKLATGYGDQGTEQVGLTREALQGATLNFADEGIAGLRSLGGGNYDQALQEQRDAQKQFEEANPYSSMAAQLVGGSVFPLGGIGKGGSFLGKIIKNAGVGSAMGAGYGFGAGEGSTGDRLTKATGGGLIGSAIGGSVPIVGAAVKGAANAAQDLGGGVSNIAKRLMGKTVQEAPDAAEKALLGVEGVTPETLIAGQKRLAKTTRKGGKIGLMEAAREEIPGLEAQAKLAAQDPKTAKVVKDVVGPRQAATSDRVKDTFDPLSTTKSGWTGAKTAQEGAAAIEASARTQRQKIAKAAYDSAHAARPILKSKVLDKIMAEGDIQRAVGEARKWSGYGKLPQNDSRIVKKTLETLRSWKNEAYQAKDLVKGQRYSQHAKNLEKKAYLLNPALEKADKIYAKASTKLDELDQSGLLGLSALKAGDLGTAGKEIFNASVDPQQIKTLRSLFFKEGHGDAWNDFVKGHIVKTIDDAGKNTDQSFAAAAKALNRLIGDPNTEARMKEAVGRQLWAKLRPLLEHEQEYLRTSRVVSGGSQTKPLMMAEDVRGNLINKIFTVFSRNPFRGAATVAQYLTEAPPNTKLFQEMAETLMLPDKAKGSFERMIPYLQTQQTRGNRSQALRDAVEKVGRTGVGQVSGRQG